MIHNHATFLSNLILCVVFASSSFSHALGSQPPNNDVSKRQGAASALLNDFQVYEPVLTPTGSSNQYGCIYETLLMNHSFAYSYGVPFVGRRPMSAPSRSR